VATKLVECPCVCRETGSWVLGDPKPDCEFCKGKGVRKHPVMRYTLMGVICPKCGYNGGSREDNLDGFDVMGADVGCVFCPECHEEIRL